MSRDDTLHEGHRTGRSPSLKSPAPAQPGALAASCLLSVPSPVCKGRGCHPALKSRLRFPWQLIMYSRHGMLAGRVPGGAAVDVAVHSVSVFSSCLSCPPVLISLGQRQRGDNSPRSAAVSACLYLRSAALTDFLTQSQALLAPKSCCKTCCWPLSKFFLPGDVSAVKVASR